MRRMAASSDGVSWSKPRRCRAPWTASRQSSSARGTARARAPRAATGTAMISAPKLGDAVGVAQAGDVGVEGQHVGGLVEAEVAGVETSHGAGVGQAQGDGARGPEAPGVERVSDGVGEEGGVGAVAEWGVDVDVDAVGGGHGGRGSWGGSWVSRCLFRSRRPPGGRAGRKSDDGTSDTGTPLAQGQREQPRPGAGPMTPCSTACGISKSRSPCLRIQRSARGARGLPRAGRSSTRPFTVERRRTDAKVGEEPAFEGVVRADHSRRHCSSAHAFMRADSRSAANVRGQS